MLRFVFYLRVSFVIYSVNIHQSTTSQYEELLVNYQNQTQDIITLTENTQKNHVSSSENFSNHNLLETNYSSLKFSDTQNVISSNKFLIDKNHGNQNNVNDNKIRLSDKDQSLNIDVISKPLKVLTNHIDVPKEVSNVKYSYDAAYDIFGLPHTDGEIKHSNQQIESRIGDEGQTDKTIDVKDRVSSSNSEEFNYVVDHEDLNVTSLQTADSITEGKKACPWNSVSKEELTNIFNESTQCPGPKSALPSRYRKSRYLAFPEKANLVVTLNLLKATAFMMGLNTLHEVDVAFPLPRSLFVFEYETMHGEIRPSAKPPKQRVGFLQGLANLNRVWNSKKPPNSRFSTPAARPTYFPGVPNSYQHFYRGRSANDRLILLSQLESALDIFGINGKKCILHMICMARTSTSRHSLLHELSSIIFNRNSPVGYEVQDGSNCYNYTCNEMLHGLSKYLHQFSPDD